MMKWKEKSIFLTPLSLLESQVEITSLHEKMTSWNKCSSISHLQSWRMELNFTFSGETGFLFTIYIYFQFSLLFTYVNKAAVWVERLRGLEPTPSISSLWNLANCLPSMSPAPSFFFFFFNLKSDNTISQGFVRINRFNGDKFEGLGVQVLN